MFGAFLTVNHYFNPTCVIANCEAVKQSRHAIFINPQISADVSNPATVKSLLYYCFLRTGFPRIVFILRLKTFFTSVTTPSLRSCRLVSIFYQIIAMTKWTGYSVTMFHFPVFFAKTIISNEFKTLPIILTTELFSRSNTEIKLKTVISCLFRIA